VREIQLDDGSRLVRSTQSEAAGQSRSAVDPSAIESTLRDFKGDAVAMADLRLLLWEAGVSGLDGMDDDAVIHEATHLVQQRKVLWVDLVAPVKAGWTTPVGETEAAPVEEPPPPPEETHKLHFEFVTETGDPIEDPAGFTLIKPDGSKEEGKLSKGKLERSGVEPGTYKMKFKYIESAAWSKSSSHPEEYVELKVTAKGFEDGKSVKLKIFDRHGIKPIKEVEGKLKGGAATASWKYSQKVGDPPRGTFMFEAWIGDKFAESGTLTIDAHPVEDLKGVQERLKSLGYDPGAIDGVMGPKTKDAVKAFQEDHPPLAVDGIPGPNTQRALGEA